MDRPSHGGRTHRAREAWPCDDVADTARGKARKWDLRLRFCCAASPASPRMGTSKGLGEDLVLRSSPAVGWELKGAPPSPGPLPAADRRGGTDGQPAAPSLRPHREAAAQAATRLQHPLPVQGPRPAANVRGECVWPPHLRSHPQRTAQVSERPPGFPASRCPLGPALL